MPPRLKVCCISSLDEARVAVSCGAHALGLVARMPSGPGPIDDDLIAAIADSVPPPVATFLLTSEVDPDAVVDHVRRARVNTVQLVDDSVRDDVYGALRAELAWVRIVQVIHVQDARSVERALRIARGEVRPHALLLDSGNPSRRELGGTGRVHDWALSREIVTKSPLPCFLAGGLNAGNVRAAIEQVEPYGIDLCSGVRTNGSLDRAKLEALCGAMRDASAPAHSGLSALCPSVTRPLCHFFAVTC